MRKVMAHRSSGLAHWGVAASFLSSELAAERGRQAIELAQRHGWSGEPVVAIAYPMLAGSLIWQGELDEAERWLMGGYALSAAHPLTTEVRVPPRRPRAAGGDRASRCRLDRDGRRGTRKAGYSHRYGGVAARPGRPASGDRRARAVLDGSVPGSHQVWLIAAFLLEASARDALGEREAAGRALERGLDLAEPAGLLIRASRADPEDHRRARRTPAGQPRPQAAPPRAPTAPARAAQPGRSPRPAPPADQPFRAGDRPRALCVGEHGPDAHAAPVRQARRPSPPGGHRPGPCSWPARRPATGLNPPLTPFCGMKLAPA